MMQEKFQEINMKYDYNHEYPKSRRNSIIGSIFMILFVVLLYTLSDFNLVFLIVAILFSMIGVGIIFNIRKNQIIIFDQHMINIEWFILMKNINEKVWAEQIRLIQFKTVTHERETLNYHIVIQTLEKRLKLIVTPVQYYDLMPYFKKFCDINHIELIGYEKDNGYN
jgi:uncharacterized membrane protein